MMDPAPVPSGKWSDLRTRILSAVVMVAVGAVEIWLGGLAFAVLVVALTGVMIWELATMTAPLERRSALVVAGVAGVALVAALVLKREVAVLFLTVPSVALLLTQFAFVRSGWVTLRQGGVRWRDTFYPLDILKANVYRSPSPPVGERPA